MPTAEQLRVLMLAHGHILAQAVYTAAALGVADVLVAGACTAEEIASSTDTHAPSLYRLLRALAGAGIFAEDERGRFSLTPLGETLRSDGSTSLRAALLMAGHPQFYRPIGEMAYSVRTGQPAFDHVFGAPAFEYQARNPDIGLVFDRGMANFASLENAPIARSYDFRGCSRVVDVGGGQGGFLAEVLAANPTLRGVLCDQAHVLREPVYLDAAGVRARCELVGMNMFEQVPAGGDAYVLKRILHDWDDETCVGLLRRCREAMAPGGRVLVVDAVVAPRGIPDASAVSDLLMLALLPGRERTEAEFRTLFTAAGLQVRQVVSTPAMLGIVEGVRA